MPRTADDLLEDARSRLERVTAERANAELDDGAILVDTRTSEQRSQGGEIPHALLVGLNVLEWRLDPASPSRLDEATDHGLRIIVLCQEGFSSSLAAARLQDLGFAEATDVIGGFEAWRDAGLPLRRT